MDEVAQARLFPSDDFDDPLVLFACHPLQAVPPIRAAACQHATARQGRVLYPWV
jgi:hypothetical protein